MIHVFRSKIFGLTVAKNFVWESFCALFQRMSGTEKIYGEEGGGETEFSAENFLSHRAEKIRRGTLLCFTKILVSNEFLEKNAEF